MLTALPLLLACLGAAVGQPAVPASDLLPYWQPGRGLGPLSVTFETGAAPAGAPSEGAPEEQLARIAELLEQGGASPGLLLLRRAQIEEQLGRTDDARRDLTGARESLTREVREQPDAVWLRLALAKLLLAEEQAEEARKLLREGLDHAPGAAALLITLLPLDPNATDRIMPCEEGLRQALAADPTDREALCGLATTAGLRISMQLDPELTQLCSLGHYAELESELGLIAAFRRRHEALPDDPMARRDTARAYVLLGSFGMGGGEDALLEIAPTGDRALAEFLEPVAGLLGDLTREPTGDLSSFGAQVLSLGAAGDVDGVLGALRAAIAVHPREPALRVRLAELLLDLKDDMAGAEEVTRVAREECPSPAVTATGAWIAFRKGDDAGCRNTVYLLLDALGRGEGGEDGPALYRRCLLLLAGLAVREGKLEEALGLLEHADKQVPSPSVSLDRALVLYLTGQATSARDLICEVAGEDTRNRVSRRLLEHLFPQ